ncbi:MAG: hypothetical protein R2712_09315 [Vicinamibacterales bacterium]
MAAWAACNALRSKDVIIDLIVAQDSKTVDLTIKYTGGAKSGISFYSLSGEGFQCDLQGAVESADGVEIGPRAISAHCVRANSVAEIGGDGTKYEVLPRGTISVRTASYPFLLYFAPEYRPSLPDSAAARLAREIERIEDQLTRRIEDGLATKLDSARWDAATANNASSYGQLKVGASHLQWSRTGSVGLTGCQSVKFTYPFAAGAQPFVVITPVKGVNPATNKLDPFDDAVYIKAATATNFEWCVSPEFTGASYDQVSVNWLAVGPPE